MPTVKLPSENCTSLPNVSQLSWDCDHTGQTLMQLVWSLTETNGTNANLNMIFLLYIKFPTHCCNCKAETNFNTCGSSHNTLKTFHLYIIFIYLGPSYTRSQGQCSTQIQHSYQGKSWNQPQGLYTRSQGWYRKKKFNLPQVTSKCWTLWPCIGPKAEKRRPPNLGGQFATLEANVPTFINIMSSMF
jgi:hypothetical protein